MANAPEAVAPAVYPRPAWASMLAVDAVLLLTFIAEIAIKRSTPGPALTRTRPAP